MTKSQLQKKCDKLLQELGREVYKKCGLCGGTYSCLHHFITKGASNNLRYDWDNLIPVCQKCHFTFHTKDDPEVYESMIEWLGMDRLNRIKAKRRQYVKTDTAYYKNIYDKLTNTLNEKVHGDDPYGYK